jgi:signal transduction histidine kinase
MFNTLYIKLSSLLVLLFIVIGVLLFQLTRYSTDMYYQEITQRLNAPVAMYVVDEAQLIDNSVVNVAALKSLAHHAMVINPSVEVYLLDPEGKILAHGLAPDSVVHKQVALQPIREFLKNGARMPIHGEDPRGGNSRKIFSVSEVRSNGALEGYVYIILGGQKYEQLASSAGASQVLRLSTAAVIACLLFGLGSALLIFARLSRRLRQLIGKADRFWSGETGETGPRKNKQDEIAQLDHAFDAMQERIEQQLHQIQETDRTRRELITNISHDLRTPLTSMQGYIETLLLKGEVISPDQRREYLEVARNHAQRLGALVADLFELAKLDSHAVKPQLEHFSLAELVHDITQDFTLAAEQKQITLNIEANNPEVQVCADIRLIERVFENLLENALRYTPEQGQINIALHHSEAGVRVTVSDNGSGISAEDLPHIFDRFFHANDKSERQIQSTGLGLAIVKRILELHNSAISVSSKLKEGTVFSFKLPTRTHEAFI